MPKKGKKRKGREKEGPGKIGGKMGGCGGKRYSCGRRPT